MGKIIVKLFGIYAAIIATLILSYKIGTISLHLGHAWAHLFAWIVTVIMGIIAAVLLLKEKFLNDDNGTD